MGINLLAWLFQAQAGPASETFYYLYGLVPAKYTIHEMSRHFSGFNQVYSLFTYMFLHGGFWHLLGNMWSLYIFGDNVEAPFRTLVANPNIASLYLTAFVVEKLIEKGANKSIRNINTNQSLLHSAAIYGYGDVAKILIATGLDVNVRDNSGKTPLYYAQKFGHKTVADPLIKAGAKTEKTESNFGDSKYLKKIMQMGEAYIWLLKNRGYVIKTKNHLFILDNEETGRKPDTPSIDNGHYSLSELRNHKVLAVYSAYHAHGGPGEFIHTLENSLENITYLHYKDDRWRGGNKSLYLKGHETHNIYGAEIITMEAHEIYGMGSLGYLVKVDGLTFFYSSFPTSKTEEFNKEVDFAFG